MSQKIKFQNLFQLGVYEIRLGERIPNMVSTLSLDNIWPMLWQKKTSKLSRITISTVLTVFRPKHGSNIIQTPFWDEIWNPLTKADLLDPNLKQILKLHFLGAHHSISKSSVAMRRYQHSLKLAMFGTVLKLTSYVTIFHPDPVDLK